MKLKFLFVIPLGLAHAEGKNKPLSTGIVQSCADNSGGQLSVEVGLPVPCIGCSLTGSLGLVTGKDNSVSYPAVT